MLALMPQTPPTATASPLTMSLAVLPHNPVSLPSSSAPLSYPSIPSSGPSRRPKLSLNTASLPTSIGKSTTALRIETLSVASPTSRNTFQNAFGASSPSTPSEKPKLSRLNAPTPLRTSSSDSVSSSVSSNSATSTESYATSASSTDSISPPVPYRLPYNAKSILSNGPLPRIKRRKSFTTTRPMFPSPKKVSFRSPLTEDIHTEKYTMAHIDIESTSSSISSLCLPPPQLVLRGISTTSKTQDVKKDDEQITESPTDMDQDVNCRSEPRSPHTGDKRESSDEEDSDTCPSTPISRHNKRRREWVWTLGPIKSQPEQNSTSSSEEEDKASGKDKQ